MAATTTTTIEDLHSDIIARALRHMDGPTLAAAGSSTSLLRSLSSDPALWRHLCLSTWPSLHHPRLLPLLARSPHHFFSDSFPFPVIQNGENTPLDINRDNSKLPTHLISAIDMYHKGIPIFSRVIETDTTSSWFLSSPFRVDGLDRKDPDLPSHLSSTEPAIKPEDLTLSWLLIDPNTQQAVNLSSRRSVAIDRHWYTGETVVRFAMVLNGYAFSIVVMCGEEMGHLREVSMTVEDMDGRSVSGKDSLIILKMAMEGERKGAKWAKEIKSMYEEYLKRKRESREKKARREGMMDLCCTGFGALMFLTFVLLLAFR